MNIGEKDKREDKKKRKKERKESKALWINESNGHVRSNVYYSEIA